MNQGLPPGSRLRHSTLRIMNVTRLFLVSLLLALPACSKKAPAQAGVPKPVEPGWKTVADAPEGFRQKAETFGKTFEQNVRDGETQEIQQVFDSAAITEGVCEGISAGGSRLDQFKKGLQQGLKTGTLQLAKTWIGQEPKFKRLVIYHGGLAARFRFVSEKNGISLVDLVLRTNSAGGVGIVNLCNHAIGYDMVEQSRRTAIPILAEMDKSFLERLVNKPDAGPDDLAKFGELPRQVSAGHYERAVELYRSLPPSLRDNLSATSLYLSALQQSPDTARYKTALKEAAARFKTASFQFMLVDVYALEKNWDKAVGCIDSFMAAIESDAALLALKSLLLNAKGDVPAAKAALTEAFKLEPDCVYVHLRALDVLLAARDYPALRDSMNFLEKSGGYNFKGHLNEPVWEDFKRTPESAAWR